MKNHRPSLAYKRQMQPNRIYADLRQKHKVKIADWMFKAACEYYQEHGEIPKGKAASAITDKMYEKIVSTCIWVPYDEVHQKFLSELPGYEARIKENGLPEKPPSSSPQPAPKKKHQQSVSELRQENEAAVHRFAALPVRHELEKGRGFL